MSTAAVLPSGPLLAAFYFFFLGSMGLMVSYLPLALQERGISLAELSLLLLFPAGVRIMAPTLWGMLADRYALAGPLLRVSAWVSLLAYLPLLSGEAWVVGVGLSCYVFIRIPASVLIDTLAFQKAAASGTSFGRYRLWGTVGYVLATLGGGYLAEAKGASFTVASGLGALLCAALLTLWLPPSRGVPSTALWPALKALAVRRRFLLFMGALMLHTTGQTTYDNFFPVHLEHLGIDRRLIGWSVAGGATCEVLVMAFSGRLMAKVGVERLLIGASLLAAVRWLLNATVTDPTWLVLIQLLHGITFGAWYTAAATWINAEAPREVQASAQGLLSVGSYGFGGILAMLVGMGAGNHGGTTLQFQVCAVFALLAAGLSWGVRVRAASQDSSEAPS
ncbi:MAG: MFS transporter [Myxococcota bacterium]